jgi:hypothetical protein
MNDQERAICCGANEANDRTKECHALAKDRHGKFRKLNACLCIDGHFRVVSQRSKMAIDKSPSDKAALGHSQASTIKVMIGTPSYTRNRPRPSCTKKVGGRSAGTAIFATKLM